MLGLLWVWLELVLFKGFLEAFGQNWVLIFGLGILGAFLKLLFSGAGDESRN